MPRIGSAGVVSRSAEEYAAFFTAEGLLELLPTFWIDIGDKELLLVPVGICDEDTLLLMELEELPGLAMLAPPGVPALP